MGTIRKPLTTEHLKQCETMSGFGMTQKQMAAVLGLSINTFDARLKDTPALREAINRGLAVASFQVRNTAFQMAVSGKHAVMTIFWLKVREHWKPVEDIEAQKKSLNINLNYLPKSQRSEVITLDTKVIGAEIQTSDTNEYDWE